MKQIEKRIIIDNEIEIDFKKEFLFQLIIIISFDI